MFRVLLDAQYGAHILFTLPEVPLPDAAAGIRIGGPVSLEGLLAALYDGLRLADAAPLRRGRQHARQPEAAAQVHARGAARDRGGRDRRAQRRPAAHRERPARASAPDGCAASPAAGSTSSARSPCPVMTDALDRSLLLAAAMDARGYGRVGGRAALDAGPPRRRCCSAGSSAIAHRHLRAARQHRPALPRPADAAGRRGARLGRRGARAAAGSSAAATARTRGGSRSGAWPAIGVAVAAVDRGGQHRRPHRAAPVAQPAAVARSCPLVPAAAVLLGLLPAWIAPPVRLPAARPPAVAREPQEHAA